MTSKTSSKSREGPELAFSCIEIGNYPNCYKNLHQVTHGSRFRDPQTGTRLSAIGNPRGRSQLSSERQVEERDNRLYEQGL